MKKLCPQCSSELIADEANGASHCNGCRWRGHICGLCQHAEGNSKHHAIPASRGGKETVRLCRPCHDHIHATFTNKQLAKSYSSIELLMANDRIASFAAWRNKHHLTIPKIRWGKERHRYSKYA